MKYQLAVIIILSALSGCATYGTIAQDTHYTGLGNLKRMVIADPDRVDKECYDKHGTEDDGSSSGERDREVIVYGANGQKITSYRVHDSVKACYDPSNGTIWLSTLVSMKAFLHELCHAGMGLSEKECAHQFPGI